MKIIDAHTHVSHVEDGSAPLFEIAERLGYEKFSVMSCQCNGNLSQNIACAVCKIENPGKVYAFAGLDYITGRDFLTQVKKYREMGYDGMKMLEGKPAVRKSLGMALDDPVYDEFYTFLEETQFPVLFHVADPGTFWDKNLIPGWALEHGWFYDESFVPYEQFYTEVDNFMRKHPRLHAIFAHFYFLSCDPERAQKFLDDYPNVSLDITAGIEMYEDFSKDTALWKDFFIRNSGRIIFGTDSTDDPPVPGEMTLNSHSAMEIEFLLNDHEIQHYDLKLHGLGLPADVAERILYKNIIAFVGETPKPMDVTAVRKESELLRGYVKDAQRLEKFDAIACRLPE